MSVWAVVVAAGRGERFGGPKHRASVAGRPVIGTRVGATPELLAPIDGALLVDPPTAPALAAAIGAFLARADRAGLKARCRAHTEAYGWDRVAGQLEDELRTAGRR